MDFFIVIFKIDPKEADFEGKTSLKRHLVCFNLTGRMIVISDPVGLQVIGISEL